MQKRRPALPPPRSHQCMPKFTDNLVATAHGTLVHLPNFPVIRTAADLRPARTLPVLSSPEVIAVLHAASSAAE